MDLALRHALHFFDICLETKKKKKKKKGFQMAAQASNAKAT